jgi:hypothetical protein
VAEEEESRLSTIERILDWSSLYFHIITYFLHGLYIHILFRCGASLALNGTQVAVDFTKVCSFACVVLDREWTDAEVLWGSIP